MTTAEYDRTNPFAVGFAGLACLEGVNGSGNALQEKEREVRTGLQGRVDSPIVFDDLERCSFRVDHRAYTDDDLAAREMTRIFDRCWLYVGHESEVPEPGSYVARDVGGRPVVMARGSDEIGRAHV